MAERAGRLENKVAVVTGAGGGIGLAIAERFGEEGARVVLAELSDENGKKAEAHLAARGIHAVYMRTNVADRESVQSTVDRTLQEVGPLDIMVNNAGITRDKKLQYMTDSQWEDVIGVHLNGTFYGTQIAGNAMIEAGFGGSIVNASSISARHGNIGQVNYTAAKAGIVAITQSSAKELAKYSIRVNAVMPGMTDTDMVAGMKPEVRAAMEAQIPLGRAATAREVANVYLFLASDESSYVTRSVYPVDGGLVF